MGRPEPGRRCQPARRASQHPTQRSHSERASPGNPSWPFPCVDRSAIRGRTAPISLLFVCPTPPTSEPEPGEDQPREGADERRGIRRTGSSKQARRDGQTARRCLNARYLGNDRSLHLPRRRDLLDRAARFRRDDGRSLARCLDSRHRRRYSARRRGHADRHVFAGEGWSRAAASLGRSASGCAARPSRRAERANPGYEDWHSQDRNAPDHRGHGGGRWRRG